MEIEIHQRVQIVGTWPTGQTATVMREYGENEVIVEFDSPREIGVVMTNGGRYYLDNLVKLDE